MVSPSRPRLPSCDVPNCTRPMEAVLVQMLGGRRERRVCRVHGEAVALGERPLDVRGELSVEWIIEDRPVTAERLFASARRHASRGLQARAAGHHDDAALHLGTMLEHLAKASLAHRSPTLLIEDRVDFPTLARLAGHGGNVRPGHSLKTVGLQGALERIGELRSGTQAAGKEFARRFAIVITARNGSAHLGDSFLDDDRVAQVAIRGAEALLPDLDESVDDFFAEWAGAARALLDELASVTRQRVELKLSRGRSTWAERIGSLSPSEAIEELRMLDAIRVDPQRGRRTYPCPACAQTAVLDGDLVGRIAVGQDGGFVLTEMELHVKGLRCPACGLHLVGVDELREADIKGVRALGPPTLEDLDQFAPGEDLGSFTEDDLDDEG